eukprot:6186843-Pleurochrysis_carterae.AAC.3
MLSISRRVAAFSALSVDALIATASQRFWEHEKRQKTVRDGASGKGQCEMARGHIAVVDRNACENCSKIVKRQCETVRGQCIHSVLRRQPLFLFSTFLPSKFSFLFSFRITHLLIHFGGKNLHAILKAMPPTPYFDCNITTNRHAWSTVTTFRLLCPRILTMLSLYADSSS